MNFKFFDIHSHLNLEPLLGGKAEVLARMRERGMGTITVGTDFQTSKLAVQIAEENGECFATVGLHPTDNATEDFDISKYFELAQNPKVVAIGECGLDYFRITNDQLRITKEKQKELFEKHIELAKKTNKPLMIHSRPSKGSMDAYEDVLEILSGWTAKLEVNFHFFVGDLTIAKKIVEKGWTMSFDGPITFARDYDEVIKNVPIENIMCETDAPFAAPAPFRGQTCEPYMVEEVYKKIAELKGLSTEEVQAQIAQNIKRVFGI